ncbi:glycoside hydrolase family 3 C-terminal domain-containing protein [Paenibacillus lautus]|uniref:glycoside hydrolase family 3 C-terminal domain-containing protein n=1 Tax=Paenibacillus lautus TaxID=1401 RepID=UPI003D9A5F3B
MVKFYAATSSEVSERELSHMQSIRNLAAECMVLLENDGTLPLINPPRKIALYGNGARHTVKGGTGSGDVNSREVIPIEQGFETAGFTVTTKKWLGDFQRRVENAKKAYADKLEAVKREQGEGASVLYYLGNPFKEPHVQAITSADHQESDTDTAIYVLARNSGEGKDRTNAEGDYLLAEEELEAIRFLAKAYAKCIVLLNIGGVVDTTELRKIQGINAILLIGQLGNVSGYAVTDALLGKTIPSGKLTDTWAASYSDYPSSETFSHINGNVDDEYYTEGIYIGYRYFDTFNITPNYCFGYGKSYTAFSIQTLDVTADGEQIMVTAEVENIGKLHPGREVVQVYTSAPAGALEKPYQELAAFAKTKLLAPGEKEVLRISFPVRAMASYSEREAAWILEAGLYYVRVGNHSRNTQVEAALSLPEAVKTVQLKNLFRDTEELKEITQDVSPYSYSSEAVEKEMAKVMVLDSSQFICETAEYQKHRPLLREHAPESENYDGGCKES